VQALSAFTGQACRKYERMDLAAVAQYLANTLKAAQPFDLLVLKALVGEMSVRALFRPISNHHCRLWLLHSCMPLSAIPFL
jgi:hypothetical protein